MLEEMDVGCMMSLRGLVPIAVACYEKRSLLLSHVQRSSLPVTESSHNITSNKLAHCSGHHTVNSKRRQVKTGHNKHTSILTFHLLTTDIDIFREVQDPYL